MPDFKDRFPNALSFKELKGRISIIELITHYGYLNDTPWVREKTCPDYPCFQRDEDKVYIINPRSIDKQKYFDFNTGRSGDLFDFVRTRLDTVFNGFRLGAKSEFGAVNAVLHHYLGIPEHQRLEYRSAYEKSVNFKDKPTGLSEAKFRQELFDLQPLENFSYLESQGIARETLYAPPFSDRFYNVRLPDFKDGQVIGFKPYINTAAPYFNDTSGQIAGLEVRNYNYKGQGISSERATSVGLSNIPDTVQHIVHCEGFKDALSHYEYYKPANVLYCYYGGNLTYEQINTTQRILSTLNVAPDAVHWLGFDNDKEGVFFDFKYITQALAERYPSFERNHSADFFTVSFGETPDIVLFADKLGTHLQEYNRSIIQRGPEEDAPDNGIASTKKEEDISKFLFKYGFSDGKFVVEIPKSYFGVNCFNQAYIDAAGLSEKLIIHKAALNDFNDDLKYIKTVVKPQYAEYFSQHIKELKSSLNSVTDKLNAVSQQIRKLGKAEVPKDLAALKRSLTDRVGVLKILNKVVENKAAFHHKILPKLKIKT